MSVRSTGSSRDPGAGAKLTSGVGDGTSLRGANGVREPLSVTLPVARQISGLGNTTMYQLIKSGRLATVKIGRRRLVVYASLKGLLSGAEAQ